MKFKLICVGQTNEKYLKQGEELYLKRLNHYIKFEKVDLPDVKGAGKLSREALKTKEGELILKTIKPGEKIILLDEQGKDFNSTQFAKKIQSELNQGGKCINFVVGGAFGFSDEIYQKASGKIRLSSMTFSHQMVRLFFLEQIYRAFTIIKGEPYHNE